MKRKSSLSVLFSLVIFLFVPYLAAQDIDHVYLKNGSVIRGNIIEIEPADHVKVQDLCGNIWYYNTADVMKITSEPYNQTSKSKQDLAFEPGFANMTSLGFLIGSTYNAQVAPFSLLTVNGWRNKLGLFTGLGFGVEFLKTNYLPLFADIRYDFIKGDVVPYAVIKGGYSFPMSSSKEEYNTEYNYFGGALAGAGVGLKIKTRNSFAWDITLMYRYQKTSYKEIYDWNNQEYNYSDLYNRLELRLGFYID